MIEIDQSANGAGPLQRGATSFAEAPALLISARLKIDCMLAYELDAVCDFVFMIHASAGMSQVIVEEALLIEPATPYRTYEDPQSGNRFLRLQAQAGPFKVVYRAVVDRLVEPVDLAAPEVPVHEIPDDVLHFLMPTRYCESDHLGPMAVQLFGALPKGHSRVQAISDWVHSNIEYRIGSTQSTTTARDVLAQRLGVCRDFAHLAVTFCRALNIPARLVSGYASFPEPPPDFHAVFEAFLGGRWVLFDPSGMVPVDQVVRVASGRDAKDVAFATIFGPARMVAMSPEVTRVGDSAGAAVPMARGSVHRSTADMV